MKQLDENPTTIRKEVLTLGKLNKEDIQLIRLCKSPENKLGFGYQLAFVKTRNYFPKQNAFDIGPVILDFVCYQLNCQHELIQKYKHRRSVIQEHQNKIKRHAGKDITIFANTRLDKTMVDWQKLITQITAVLVTNNIPPGYQVEGDIEKPEHKIQGCNYVTYRYERPKPVDPLKNMKIDVPNQKEASPYNMALKECKK